MTSTPHGSARLLLVAALLACAPRAAEGARGEALTELLRRGVAQFNAGALTAALATLEGARQRARDAGQIGQIELYRGLCLALLERPDEAREAFAAALRSDPALRLEQGRFGSSVEALFRDARRAAAPPQAPPRRPVPPAAATRPSASLPAPTAPAASSRPAPRRRPARRVWTWIAAGAAAAALGAGIALGAAADSDYADWQDAVERWKQERGSEQLVALEAQRGELASSVEGKALAANIAFAAAGVLAGAAVAAFFLEGRRAERGPRRRARLRTPALFALEF